MADTLKNLYSGELGTVSATLYTVPVSTTTIVKEIILANKTATATTATIKFAGSNIIATKSIPSNDTLIVPLTSILIAGALIEGLAGTATAIDCYISGIEVA